MDAYSFNTLFTAVPITHLASNQYIIGDRHATYKKDVTEASTVSSTWNELVQPVVAEWRSGCRDALEAESQSLHADLAAAAAHKRSLMTNAATAATPSRARALVCLSWSITSAAHEEARSALARLQRVLCERLYGSVLAVGVENLELLAAALGRKPSCPTVACSVMQLVHAAVDKQAVWLQQRVDQHTSELEEERVGARAELRRSLDSARGALAARETADARNAEVARGWRQSRAASVLFDWGARPIEAARAAAAAAKLRRSVEERRMVPMWLADEARLP